MKPENIFEITNLDYSFMGKYPALCGVTLNVRSGESVVILGANGSGKSSLLNLLDGLVFAQKGEIRFMGQLISESILKDDEFNRYFRSRVGLCKTYARQCGLLIAVKTFFLGSEIGMDSFMTITH